MSKLMPAPNKINPTPLDFVPGVVYVRVSNRERTKTVNEQLINIHPADELAALREEIKQLQTRESELRDLLLAPGAHLAGDQYVAAILPSTRETVDKAALIADLGKEAVAKYLKTTHVRSVRLLPTTQG